MEWLTLPITSMTSTIETMAMGRQMKGTWINAVMI